MLFVWARALVLSRMYNLEMVAPTWFKPLRVGPWIRRERDKRYYLKDFTNQGYISGVEKYYLLASRKSISEERFLSTSPGEAKKGLLVRVRGFDGHFSPLLEFRNVIVESINSIVNESIAAVVSRNASSSYIGVHIRRGDFKLLGQDIPIMWYCEACRNLRVHVDEDLPVRVFSDGCFEELRPILNLGNVVVERGNPAVLDLLLLAKSHTIIGTSLSTFSLWGSFLGNCPTIWPPVSPGVYGYGLHTDNHIIADWNGRFDYNSRYSY